MKTYEYKVVNHVIGGWFVPDDGSELEKLIEPHAREGWRLVSTCVWGHYTLYLFFERERPETPAQAPAQATARATGQKPAQTPRQAPVQAPRLKPIPPVPPHAPRPRH